MKLILCRVKSSETSELEEMRTEMSNWQSQANDRFEREPNKGLVDRRKREKALFLTPDGE